MNIYFLLEGEKTEKKVYPKWLSILIPELQQVRDFDAVEHNNYYILVGYGYPSLFQRIESCVADINQVGKYDYFVVCLDTDDCSVQERRQEVIDYIREQKIIFMGKTQLEIITQKKCIETWFLGHRKIFKKNPSNEYLRECVTFYDVKNNDPELMDKLPTYDSSVSMFHSNYLTHLFLEKRLRYTKSNPEPVTEEHFVQELIQRHKKTGHIASFGYFVAFCQRIREQIRLNNIINVPMSEQKT